MPDVIDGLVGKENTFAYSGLRLSIGVGIVFTALGEVKFLNFILQLPAGNSQQFCGRVPIAGALCQGGQDILFVNRDPLADQLFQMVFLNLALKLFLCDAQHAGSFCPVLVAALQGHLNGFPVKQRFLIGEFL